MAMTTMTSIVPYDDIVEPLYCQMSRASNRESEAVDVVGSCTFHSLSFCTTCDELFHFFCFSCQESWL
jgi:hypothetical protein